MSSTKCRILRIVFKNLKQRTYCFSSSLRYSLVFTHFFLGLLNFLFTRRVNLFTWAGSLFGSIVLIYSTHLILCYFNLSLRLYIFNSHVMSAILIRNLLLIIILPPWRTSFSQSVCSLPVFFFLSIRYRSRCWNSYCFAHFNSCAILCFILKV